MRELIELMAQEAEVNLKSVEAHRALVEMGEPLLRPEVRSRVVREEIRELTEQLISLRQQINSLKQQKPEDRQSGFFSGIKGNCQRRNGVGCL